MPFLKEQKSFFEAIIMSRVRVVPRGDIPEGIRLAAEDRVREGVTVQISHGAQISLAWNEASRRGVLPAEVKDRQDIVIDAVTELHVLHSKNPDKDLAEVVTSRSFGNLVDRFTHPDEGARKLRSDPEFRANAIKIYMGVIKPILDS